MYVGSARGGADREPASYCKSGVENTPSQSLVCQHQPGAGPVAVAEKWVALWAAAL